jgi:hypothetical protein
MASSKKPAWIKPPKFPTSYGQGPDWKPPSGKSWGSRRPSFQPSYSPPPRPTHTFATTGNPVGLGQIPSLPAGQFVSGKGLPSLLFLNAATTFPSNAGGVGPGAGSNPPPPPSTTPSNQVPSFPLGGGQVPPTGGSGGPAGNGPHFNPSVAGGAPGGGPLPGHSGFSGVSGGGGYPPYGGGIAPPTVLPFAATIKPELKWDIPKWDGDPKKAIPYFFDVQSIAATGNLPPDTLEMWLWKGLKEGSAIQCWYQLLTPPQLQWMRSHYLCFLLGIHEGYLGDSWQLEVQQEFESQAFCQKGYERETPMEFITRQMIYARMLSSYEPGSPEELHLIWSKVPISWNSVVNVKNLRHSGELYPVIAQYSSSLLHSSQVESSQVLTVQNLESHLRKLGFGSDNFRKSHRAAHLAESEEMEPSQTSSLLPTSPHRNLQTIDFVAQVYAVAKKKQRPLPKKFFFSKNDHVKTKMKKPPPSPCKVCGSEYHWDRECPDWSAYLEMTKKSGFSVSTEGAAEPIAAYDATYEASLEENLSDLLLETRGEEDFPTRCVSSRHESPLTEPKLMYIHSLS